MMGIQGFHNMFFVEQHAHMNILLSPPNVSSAPISKKNTHLKSMKYKSLKPSLQKLTAGMEATNGRLWKMIFPFKMVYVFFSVSSPISSVEVLCVSPFCSKTWGSSIHCSPLWFRILANPRLQVAPSLPFKLALWDTDSHRLTEVKIFFILLSFSLSFYYHLFIVSWKIIIFYHVIIISLSFPGKILLFLSFYYHFSSCFYRFLVLSFSSFF